MRTLTLSRGHARSLGVGMPRTKLLDRGEEIMVAYPEVLFKDKRGNLQRRPGKQGRELRVSVSKERMSSSDLIGQVSISLIRCTTRSAPGWDYARIVFRGEEWDVVTPPHLSSGVSRASRHWEFTLRSRNRLDDGGNVG